MMHGMSEVEHFCVDFCYTRRLIEVPAWNLAMHTHCSHSAESFCLRCCSGHERHEALAWRPGCIT
jgi:hypothetical protein